ncbi:hypothetical protein PTSG_09505 [Salpingoeca rosetta]|uniref:Protein kinase domain-containing protein n=1 Tax=Salpingoeca rosetta (strain ATCC 50818 / BSB-021) TaxID=946362 RepID=F2UL72_SALR5|nr:uncharacterized protein PTSG_09505 [Salpingoeca rosetta]EGD77871.1 hypothetical protein PTSG_09505 [Salpingoeca rosetta]|eukprot:XP_004989935.1 hypothetical protein PTSG_09505 [Salpingoeca rosetta]
MYSDENPDEMVEDTSEHAHQEQPEDEASRQRTTTMRDEDGGEPATTVDVSQFTANNNVQVCQVNATVPNLDPTQEEVHVLSYVEPTVIGTGSFGVVFKAVLQETNEAVAIKKVLQDQRYKNRELDIFREVSHGNLLKLKYYFFTSGQGPNEVYLNLITDFFPDTLAR